MSSTPLQASSYMWPVYADPAATMSGGTPLVVAISKAGKAADYNVTVKLQLLIAYDRVIFELQQQLAHYKSLVDVLLPKPPQTEELRLDAAPLNAASVRLLDSITRARISPLAVRSLDQDERE
jgi:hypothetical protein